MAKEISSSEFENEVKNSKTPVVVDYWAEWCSPCKMFAPVFNTVSKKFYDKIKFFKLNVDENNDISSSEGVMSIPTVIFYKNGEEIKRFVGAKSERDFEEWIKKEIEFKT